MKDASNHSSNKESKNPFSEHTLRKITNFCETYQEGEIDELNSRLFNLLLGENYSQCSSFMKERILEYLEATEEVLSAIHELQNQLRSLSPPQYPEPNYIQKNAYREAFALMQGGKSKK